MVVNPLVTMRGLTPQYIIVPQQLICPLTEEVCIKMYEFRFVVVRCGSTCKILQLAGIKFHILAYAVPLTFWIVLQARSITGAPVIP